MAKAARITSLEVFQDFGTSPSGPLGGYSFRPRRSGWSARIIGSRRSSWLN